MTRTGEIFSWVGARRFSDTPIVQMVQGPISNGAFSGFLSIIFKQDVQKFAFKGITAVDGRSLMEYSFEVDLEHSSYNVHYAGSWLKSGYSGIVLVDSSTDDLVHLTVNTAALPAENTCEISTNLDLNRVKIGDSEFLLPARARQRYVWTTGEETENTTAFAHCREYLGTSSVSFGSPKPASDGAFSSPMEQAKALGLKVATLVERQNYSIPGILIGFRSTYTSANARRKGPKHSHPIPHGSFVLLSHAHADLCWWGGLHRLGVGSSCAMCPPRTCACSVITHRRCGRFSGMPKCANGVAEALLPRLWPLAFSSRRHCHPAQHGSSCKKFSMPRQGINPQ
jgi:hypothetical protein